MLNIDTFHDIASARFFACLFVTALMLTACSHRPAVTIKGAELETRQTSGKTMLGMEAILVVGKLKFPNMEVAIFNPASPSNPIGQLALQHLSDDTNRLSVEICYDQLAKQNSILGKTLPNNRDIPPFLNGQNPKLMGIPTMSKSRVYVGSDLENDLFLGVALSIPAFDGILDTFSTPLNLFTTFQFSPEMQSYGGLFNGANTGQNGIAVFVGKSNSQLPRTKKIMRSMASFGTLHPLLNNFGAIQTMAGISTEIEKMSQLTLFRLNQLLSKNATLRVQ